MAGSFSKCVRLWAYPTLFKSLGKKLHTGFAAFFMKLSRASTPFCPDAGHWR